MKAYLFDLDGTLVQSEAHKARALAAACAAFGAPHADPTLYSEVMGQDWETVTSHFFTTYRIDVGLADFNQRFRAIYSDLIEAGVPLTDGAREFIRACRNTGALLGLVSSADHWMVDRILDRVGMADGFDVIITKDDVMHHKPDPQAYLLAMSRLNIAPERTLVFEDSAAGLKAATDAGCRCVVVRHPFNQRHDLSAAFREIVSFTEPDVMGHDACIGQRTT
ncbi:phosphatase [Bradyrhizobium sp. SSBR45G]|uniref:HAD family hydrolase n=1 Tax=unclassified Bradyrhizobium TaxID=2631580 RepID=UPI0023428F7F|nr:MULTISPECIES: HAD family phosphatase [unclassified Bradyrhizobium]GLH76386.1 phosphatase [Bradyrhizobium sp. SSBR45G]GLH83130.1 phosphatase [Bradyrhizobium sp. SSBR45R]